MANKIVGGLFYIILFLPIFSISKGSDSMSETVFKADSTSKLSIPLNPTEINSAIQYRLFMHLVRPLVRVAEDGQFYGNLAKSWKFNPEFTTFAFTINNSLWSDGTPITLKQISGYFEFLLSHKKSIHYDFANIMTITTSGNDLIFILEKADKNFVAKTANPEFGISKQVDGAFVYNITSGPYFVESFDSTAVNLKLNPYYGFEHSNPPERVTFSSSSISTEVTKFKSGELDLIIPGPLLTPEIHQELIKAPHTQVIDSNIGFTYFLSFNPQSQNIKSIESRHWIQNSINSTKWDFGNKQPLWEPARQLYLPDGQGRPTNIELNEIWNKIGKSKQEKVSKVKILFNKKFPFVDNIVSQLKATNPKIIIETVFYNEFSEVDNLLKDKSIDLFQFNNDFAALDLSANINVTFNNHRPLVLTGMQTNKYNKLVDQMNNAESQETKVSGIKQIGIGIIEDGLVVPLVYNKHLCYGQKKWDFSKWSKIFADFKIWKVQSAGK